MLYATTTLKTFIIQAYSRPYWNSMAWSYSRVQESPKGARSPWRGCARGSLSALWELVGSLPSKAGVQAAPLPCPHTQGSPWAPLVAPSLGHGARARGQSALTLLMWTLSGSEREKKRRVLYRKREPRRSSSMPVPSKAAVIT